MSYIIYVLQIYSFKLGIANIQIEILFCECMKWPTRLDLNYVCAYNFLPNPLILIYCFSCSVETFLFAKHFVCFKYSISPKTVRETVLRLQKVKPFAFACLRVANNLFLCILDFFGMNKNVKPNLLYKLIHILSLSILIPLDFVRFSFGHTLK